MIRLLITLVVWWYAMDTAIHYGGIWDSQANPTDVIVTLSGDQQLTGLLTRDWDQSFVVAQPDGSESHFTEYRVMTFQTAEHATSVWHHWRMMMAFMLPNALLSLLVFHAFKRRAPNHCTSVIED